MSGQRFALIDPAAGISGDMLLGALIDLGWNPDRLQSLPERLRLTGVSVAVAPVSRCGVKATKVTVRVGRATEGPSDVSDTVSERPGAHHHEAGHHHHQSHGHEHLGSHSHGDHPHRHVADLVAMIAAGDLSDRVKATATQVFRLLAQAEGRIHGVDPDHVALHEVGAFDALVDIVGAVEGFEEMGLDLVYTKPVAVGNGWVHAAHGVLPVPAPATALLLEGLALAPNGPVVGEATTPTGAALLKTLSAGPLPPGAWTPRQSGWGAGGRDPAAYPNALRVMIGEQAPNGEEELLVLATDLDDLSPEYLEPLRDALMGAGALDVVNWSTQMKKGRLGFRVEALVRPDDADAVVTAFFRHSTTAGVRRTSVARRALQRDHWTVPGPDGGRVRVKTLHGPDGPRVKPEYDDVISVAVRTGQPAHELSRRLQKQASDIMAGHARSGSAGSLKKES